MANRTITQFPAGGTQYRISFDYLARPFVVVTLVNSSDNSKNKVLTVGVDYKFVTITSIEMLSSQSGFDIVQIHRFTSTELVVDFRDGSVLTANDLTNAELQAIHIAEEGRDQTVDLARQYAEAAGSSANKAKGSENEARRLVESMKSAGLMGYITRKSFEKGFRMTEWNEVLLQESSGEYFRWDGAFPKVVPAGSTPESTGGQGAGKWLSVGDATLRTELARGRFKFEDAESIYYVPNINFDTSVDNRTACLAYPKKIYIPREVTLRVNLEPADDVRKFVGEGKLLVRNKWTNATMTFDVEAATKGNKQSFKDTISEAVRAQSDISIGVVGDSISDGAWGKQDWSSPPLDSNRDLKAPIDYDHSLGGGSHSWVAHWKWLMNMVQSRWSASPIFKVYNCSLSGAKLSDGWGYRNFDIGFFGNERYKSRAPRVCLLAMGWNDTSQNMEVYRDQIDMFVRKAWGYGCAVGIVTVNNNDPYRVGFEAATKRQMCKRLGIEYFNLGHELTNMSNTNMEDPFYYYTKKEGQYDTTHPQEMGQMTMGAAMFMQTIGADYVPRVKSGSVVNTSTVELWWDAITYPSEKHLQPSYGKAGGSGKLDKMGYLPAANTIGENVTFNTFVYCEEDGMTLSILEPWTGNAKVGDNNHMRVYAPAGQALFEEGAYLERNKLINLKRTLCQGKLASSYIGGARTATTFCGRLRKGLNHISIVNGGQLPTVWYPALKFGHVDTVGIKLPMTQLNVAKTSEPRDFLQGYSALDDRIMTEVMTGRPYSMSADGYTRQGTMVGHVRCHNGLGKNQYIVVNHDPLLKRGAVLGVASDGKMAAVVYDSKDTTWETKWNLVGDITTKTFENIPFTIFVYTSPTTGEYQFHIHTDDGRIKTGVLSTLVATSGSIGVWNRADAGGTQYTLSADFGLTTL